MNKYAIIISAFLLVASLGFAQEQAVPTIRILPEDVVQTSIQQVRFGTNLFAVRWTFTEAGAKKMVAFWEAHGGQKISTTIGDFVSRPSEHVFRAMPPTFTNYAEWKQGWLKHRTDTMFVKTEADAHEILLGLKSR